MERMIGVRGLCVPLCLFLASLSLAVLPVNAQAQPGVHDGLYVNMDLGAGFMVSQVDVLGSELEASGPAGEFSVALGGAVNPSLVLAGRVWAVAVQDPTIKVDGEDMGDADATLTLAGVGLDITYYTPSNFYLSVTPSVTQLTLDADGEEEDTDTGFGLRLAVGKEWWVSENWALGLNAQAAYSRNDDNGFTWDTTWVGIAFSATFN